MEESVVAETEADCNRLHARRGNCDHNPTTSDRIMNVVVRFHSYLNRRGLTMHPTEDLFGREGTHVYTLERRLRGISGVLRLRSVLP